jgi:CheY-like chemotaxis protein
VEPNLSSTTHRVLVIDDEKVIALTLAHIFSARGYEARAVYSAEEGLELVNNWPPHLAIVDVKLPGMNGIDFAIHLIAHCSGCRLLLFSGQPDSGELLEKANRSGYALELIAKPVHPEMLLQRAAQLLSVNNNTIQN